MILGEIKQREVNECIELDDMQVLSVVQKMVKQRKNSISQFKEAGRINLVDIEEVELVVINNYVPEQLSDTEMNAAINKAIADTGASSIQDMRKLIGLLKSQLDGKTDMGVVSGLIRSKFS